MTLETDDFSVNECKHHIHNRYIYVSQSHALATLRKPKHVANNVKMYVVEVARSSFYPWGQASLRCNGFI
jgi:hypothetical protein